MESIEEIIGRYYTDIAEHIFFPCYTGGADKDFSVKAMNYQTGIDKRTPQVIFYEMIDSIIDRIGDGKGCSESSAAYYSGLTILSEGLQDATSIAKTQFDLNGKISRIEKRLYKVVPVKRIAELVYYKICHSRYHRKLELAFREVIQCIADTNGSIDSIFNKRVALELRTMTQSITKVQIDSFYDNVYIKSGIQEKYIVSREEFLNGDFPFIYPMGLNDDETAYMLQDVESRIQKYQMILDTICREANFYTLDKCFEQYRGSYKMSHNTYRDCFKKVLTALAGYTYNDKFIEKYHTSECFILKTLCGDINALTDYFCSRLNGVRDCMKYIMQSDTKSRFTYINCENDFRNIGLLISTYRQLLCAIMSSYWEEYAGDDIYMSEEAKFIENRYE